MSTYIPDTLRTRIEEVDRQRYCCCLTSKANSGIPMTYDHIQPRSKGGDTSFENLCLACRSCNEFKGSTTEEIDPVTGETVAIFHHRQQIWSEHFTWSANGSRVEGLTAMGRSTLVALRMNNPIIQAARRQ